MNAEVLITKTCQWKPCSKEYQVDIRKSNNSKYCSPECKKAIEQARYKERYKSKRTGKGSLEKICDWCGAAFSVSENLRGEGNYTKCPACREEQVKQERNCIKCAKIIFTKKAGVEIYCVSCKAILNDHLIANNISKKEHSRHRFCKRCKEIFYDDNPSKTARRNLCSDCKFFLENEHKKNYPPQTCDFCDKTFKPRQEGQICCPGCSQHAEKSKQRAKRNKICILCEESFYDTTYKNSTRVCDKCELKGFQKIVAKLQNYKRPEPRYKEKDLFDHLSHMRRDNKFYGRLGELLFLYLFPDAKDMNFEVKDNFPFDAETSLLGKIDVKTSLPGFIHKMKRWKFQNPHKDCNYLFCVSFSLDYKSIECLWLVPKKVITEGDILTYDPTTTNDPTLLRYNQYDVTSLFDLNDLNKYLQKLLSIRPAWAYDVTKLKKRSSIWKGRIGEIVFAQLHPEAKDMLIHTGHIDHPYDFEDEILCRVDVKAASIIYPDIFLFKPPENPYKSDNYFIIGFDKAFTKIIALFNVPANHLYGVVKPLKLKPAESSYEVTHKYDLSKIDVEAIKKGKWEINDTI